MLMLDNEFIVLIVNGDGAEAFHGALTQQQCLEFGSDVIHLRESVSCC